MIKLPFKGKKLNIMFTCIGRRVSLLNSFAKSARQLKLNSHFIGTDTDKLSPALQLCEKQFIVKPVSHRDYLKELLAIVKNEKVKLIVPTVDLDLKILAVNKAKFEKLGCFVLISKPKVIDICQDKRETFKFLSAAGFDTPYTWSSQSALRKKDLRYPCFLKPWDGYASRGSAIVRNRMELSFYAKTVPSCIVQEYASGPEFTCDVFVDFDGRVQCVVPRKRLEVRSGEVSKATIVKDPKTMETAAKAVEALSAGPGVITVQMIKNDNGKLSIIEINPRFGGGVPLSIQAGANFPKWILQQLIGIKPRIKMDGFVDGLTMLRYDSEVWY
ncbi:MAG: ATP-grasp domain-containing protein [Planctomycetes bacterium]|nr:ATP-grasp domain-containing protein [Planctomycetota bacterium]